MLSENCLLLGTDNIRGQIPYHIFAPNGGYCLTLTVPLSTQEYKWVPANCWGNLTNIILWESDLRWTSILSRGSRNTLGHFLLQKRIFSGSYEPILGSKASLSCISLHRLLEIAKFLSLLENASLWLQLPENVNISKEARTAIGKAASVFVLYATSW